MEVPVLPRVIRELHGVLPDSEQGHWTRVLAGQARRTGTTSDAATTNRILDAVDAASESWVREKLDAQYGDPPGDVQPFALRAVRLDDDELARARAISDAIPATCFRGPSRNDHFGDRQIIGQAAVKGYRVLGGCAVETALPTSRSGERKRTPEASSCEATADAPGQGALARFESV